MTLKYIWRSFSLGCHFHVHFSYPWHAFASHGLPAIAELLVTELDTSWCTRTFSHSFMVFIKLWLINLFCDVVEKERWLAEGEETQASSWPKCTQTAADRLREVSEWQTRENSCGQPNTHVFRDYKTPWSGVDKVASWWKTGFDFVVSEVTDDDVCIDCFDTVCFATGYVASGL